MKKIKIISALFLLAFFFTATQQSCKKDSTNNSITEYVADSTTFKAFMSWTLQKTNHGPSPSLGMGHAGNDTSVSRMVFFKNGQDPVNGVYPIGTTIVKHSTNPAGTVNEIVAMVKRGNNFNPNAGNWEWFMLMPDGKIATDANGMQMRGGASMMGGMCNSCHGGASTKDFVFSK